MRDISHCPDTGLVIRYHPHGPPTLRACQSLFHDPNPVATVRNETDQSTQHVEVIAQDFSTRTGRLTVVVEAPVSGSVVALGLRTGPRGSISAESRATRLGRAGTNVDTDANATNWASDIALLSCDAIAHSRPSELKWKQKLLPVAIENRCWWLYRR